MILLRFDLCKQKQYEKDMVQFKRNNRPENNNNKLDLTSNVMTGTCLKITCNL